MSYAASDNGIRSSASLITYHGGYRIFLSTYIPCIFTCKYILITYKCYYIVITITNHVYTCNFSDNGIELMHVSACLSNNISNNETNARRGIRVQCGTDLTGKFIYICIFVLLTFANITAIPCFVIENSFYP